MKLVTEAVGATEIKMTTKGSKSQFNRALSSGGSSAAVQELSDLEEVELVEVGGVQDPLSA
jgi:hypothetical protein